MRSTDHPTVIFLHIGKTGGSTLRKILRRNFSRLDVLAVRVPKRDDVLRPRREDSLSVLAAVPEQIRRRAKLVDGHMIFGAHELLPGPSTYITILRSPVALSISQFRYVQRTPGHRLHEIVSSRQMSIEDYVREGVSLEVDNSQTRVLSGDVSTPFGECSDGMLETAKRHIEQRFSVVGLTERFDESVVLLGKTFGWSRLAYVPVKVAPKKARAERVDPRTIRLLEELNRFDLELYRYAAQRFQETIAADPSFEDAFRRFHRAQALYRPWGTITYTLPRRLYGTIGKKR